MANTRTIVVVEIPTCYADPDYARKEVEDGYLRPMRISYNIKEVRVEDEDKVLGS